MKTPNVIVSKNLSFLSFFVLFSHFIAGVLLEVVRVGCKVYAPLTDDYDSAEFVLRQI